jgi:XTP/dITP diphosphohydrolase
MNSFPETIVLATKNQHKIDELGSLLSPLGIEIRSVRDYPELPDVIEDGDSFEANAIKKAREIALFTRQYALADDSGLSVDALNGEPGVYSARYAGEGAGDAANNQKLLQKLDGIPFEERKAHFTSVIAFAAPDGTVHTFKGTCEGVILEEPRGSFGFGYDPLFYLPEIGKSMAELALEEKNRISHRAKAYEKFLEWLRASATLK